MRKLACVTVGLFALGCDLEPAEVDAGDGRPPPPLYCDVASTRERTTNTSRAGMVSFCSAAWVEATSNVACVTPSACAAQGRRCTKEAGALSEQCVLPCGGGAVCPEGQFCRDCADAEPYCADTRTCPTPSVRRYDANGAECLSGQSVVTLPNPTDVQNLCARYGFNSVCRVSCWQSEQCCNDRLGNPMACIADMRHYNALGEHELRQNCITTCTSASDCGPTGGESSCCLPFDSDDDQYKTSRILGRSASTRICWFRGIYSFCPAISGTGGGGGGLSACEQCRRTCAGQGSWCQCTRECG